MGANNTVDDRTGASDGLSSLGSAFDEWCALLTSHSLQACYALIGANWAVHGNVTEVFNNICAKWSIGLVLSFIGINLLTDFLMVHFHFHQFLHAEKDFDIWVDEYKKHKSVIGGRTYWPYNKTIENLGIVTRFLKLLLPFIATILFVLSLF